MEIKNIAIIGSNGYIGQEIIKRIKISSDKILCVDQQSTDEVIPLDLRQPEAFNYELLKDYQLIIFTAAISGPDFCASHYEESYLINVTGTKYFINKAINQNCKVLFLSSDAVFGKDENVFDENSQTNAHTAYGKMKKEIEDSFKNIPQFKAIRLSYVFSQKDKFSQYLNSCLVKRQKVEIFHPFYRNVVTLNDVLLTIEWLISHWDSFPHTFLNVCGSELISRVQLVDEFNRLSHKKIQYKIEIPGKEFFTNRSEITEIRSLYLRNILNDSEEPFSSKIRKQLLFNK